MWFRRVEEVMEVDLPNMAQAIPRKPARFGESSLGPKVFGPRPPKRRREEVDGEDGDYTQFKRIRLITRRKRLKSATLFRSMSPLRSFGDFVSRVEASLNLPTAATPIHARTTQKTSTLAAPMKTKSIGETGILLSSVLPPSFGPSKETSGYTSYNMPSLY
jgi:hypothetical protein